MTRRGAIVAVLLFLCGASSRAQEHGSEIYLPPIIEYRTLESGARRFQILGLFHKTTLDGEVYSFHFLNFFRGPDYLLLLPFAYSIGPVGERHRGMIPFYFVGPGYRIVLPPFAYSIRGHTGLLPFFLKGPAYTCAPLLASARRICADGSSTTWITPFFHRTRSVDGTVMDFHFLAYFQGPTYKVYLPLGYSVGMPGRKHTGVIPLYFSGPGYRVVPPLLSFWRRRPDGATQKLIFPLFCQQAEPDGHRFTAVPILLSAYRTGERLDDGKFRWWPFNFQRAADAVEFNFLWGLVHYRREGAARRWIVAPFWYARRPRPGVPMAATVLGGLVARDVDYERGVYRYRFLWFLRGRVKRFAVADGGPQSAVNREEDLIEDLTTGPWRTRLSAADRIASRGPAGAFAVPSLLSQLGHRRINVRRAVAKALARIGPSALPGLRAALTAGDVRERWAACRAIGLMGPGARRAAADLGRASDDPDAGVRKAAREALVLIGADR